MKRAPALFMATLVAASSTGLLTGATTQAALAGSDREIAAAALASAPSTVHGYTDHARQRMRERGISNSEVEFTVLLYYPSARRNSQGNWRYENGGTGLVVIMNDNAYVVTVF